MVKPLTERYRDRLHGVLSCYDRIVVTGTLPQVCYAAGMTAFPRACIRHQESEDERQDQMKLEV